MSIAEGEFKAALGKWPSGVTVITASAEGRLHGMTASAFFSVSLNPRLIAVSLDLETITLDLVRHAEVFAVNVLGEHQAATSNHFASKQTEHDRFAGVEFDTAENGCPLIIGAVAQIECRLFAIHPAGDHALVVGEVTRAVVLPGEPLVYYGRQYGHFAV